MKMPRSLGYGRAILLDAGVVAAFAVFSLLHFLDRWKGASPYVFLGGDSAEVSAYAAALDNPHLFVGDALFGDLGNYGTYAVLHVDVIRWLHGFTGDYGVAHLLLLLPCVFLHLLGFYVLGRVLFRSRFWAVLLSLIAIAPVRINLGEYSGLFKDPHPRFLFASVFALLLAAAIQFRRNVWVWPWVMLAAGAATFVHPVSAPSVGFAIWLGFLPFLPERWGLARKVGFMVSIGVVFLAATSPFLVHWFETHEHGAVPARLSYDELYLVAKSRIIEGHFDIPFALRQYLGLWGARWTYWLSALVGVILIWALVPAQRRKVAQVGLWFAGLLFVSVAIPLVEQAVARSLRVMPLEIDLVRGIRYVVPLMLLGLLWPLATWSARGPRSRRAARVVGLAVVVGWLAWHPIETVKGPAECLVWGRSVCPVPPKWEETIGTIEAVRDNVPEGGRVFSLFKPNQVRYAAWRPVVYAYKDGGALLYNNLERFLSWGSQKERVNRALSIEDMDRRLEALIDVARRLRAGYLLVEDEDIGPSGIPVGLRVLWRNPGATLVALEAEATD